VPSVFEYREQETVGIRLSAVAAEYPDRLAVRADGHSVDYAIFDGMAHNIAALVAEHTAPGDRVILYMNQGVLLLAAIFGVLRAGRVYVPLDPAYPAARNGLIAESAEAGLVLTDTANASSASQLDARAHTLLNLETRQLSGDVEAVHFLVTPDSPACLLYTSGSTGQPKGVIHTHRSILHEAFRRGQLLGIKPEDRCTLLYSCSAMGALMGIFSTLLHGAALLPASFQSMSIATMVSWLRDERITVYHSVPTVLRALCAAFAEEMTFPAMRLVALGGEPVLRSDIERVFRWFPDGCRAVCAIGMSEVGTLCGWTLDRDTDYEGDRVPCGFPLPGIGLAVIREDGCAAAPGEVGELQITSPYLFSGYWLNDAATDAAISIDAGDDHTRVFQTGDLVSMDDQGLVRFHARRDTQLSVRGFRVEAGEVESALMRHPDVAAAAVAVLYPEPEVSLLAAFVVLRAGVCEGTHLRRHLTEMLPMHMVPSHYRILEALPQTPNGKLDRRALHDIEAHPVAQDCEMRAPGTPVEMALHALFLKQLPGTDVGVFTNFFDAGGTSLSAIQLLSEVETRYGRRVPLISFFADPTIAGVVAALSVETEACAAAIVPIRELGSRPPLFFMLGGELYRPLVRRLDAAIPAHTVMLEWESAILLDDGRAQNEMTLDDLAQLQTDAILGTQPEGPYYLAGSSFGGKLAYVVAQNLRARGKVVAFLGLFDPSLIYPEQHFSAGWVWHQIALFFRLGARHALHRIYRSAWPRLRRRAAGWRVGNTPSDTGNPVADLRLMEKRRIEIYYRLSRNHTWTSYDGGAVLYRARDSTHALIRHIDPTQGWGALVKGGLTMEDVPGDHTGILDEPNVAVLAQKMNAHLAATYSVSTESRCAI